MLSEKEIKLAGDLKDRIIKQVNNLNKKIKNEENTLKNTKSEKEKNSLEASIAKRENKRENLNKIIEALELYQKSYDKITLAQDESAIRNNKNWSSKKKGLLRRYIGGKSVKTIEYFRKFVETVAKNEMDKLATDKTIFDENKSNDQEKDKNGSLIMPSQVEEKTEIDNVADNEAKLDEDISKDKIKDENSPLIMPSKMVSSPDETLYTLHFSTQRDAQTYLEAMKNKLPNIKYNVLNELLLPTHGYSRSYLYIEEMRRKLSDIEQVKVNLLTDVQNKTSYSFSVTPEQWHAWRTQAMYDNAQDKPIGNFVIKSVRSDRYSYYSTFVEGITSGKQVPLRQGMKGKITVTGEGIFERPNAQEKEQKQKNAEILLKTPQFTLEEKKGFSKTQSASIGTATYSPPVFRYDLERNEALTGILLDTKDKSVLFTHRNYIYDDRGTVKRPYDFLRLEDAQKYFNENKRKILFSAHELEDLINAMENNPVNRGKYNEVLVRLRWMPTESSKIIIANNCLRCRLQAQEYARILEKKLLEKGSVYKNYSIPIIFYIPNSELHFKSYSLEDKTMDMAEARMIYANPNQRQTHYKNMDFQFLLALQPEDIKTALNEPHESNQPLLWYILQCGLVHIIESLVDRLDSSLYKLALDPNNQPSFFNENSAEHLIRTGHGQVVAEYISRQPGDIKLSNPSFADNLLTMAIQYKMTDVALALIQKVADVNEEDNGYSYLWRAAGSGLSDIAKALIQRGANMSYTDYRGQTPLHIAANNGHLDVIKILIEMGADINVVEKNGSTPLSLAEKNGHLEVANLLKKAINDKNSTSPAVTAALLKTTMFKKPSSSAEDIQDHNDLTKKNNLSH